MRILTVGGTGVIGRIATRLLVADRHEVIAVVKNEGSASIARNLGARPVVADVLDRQGLAAVVEVVRPEAIIHQLTALSGAKGNFRRLDKEFALTNRFRTEVTDTLLAAARRTGTRRFVAQSFCGWPFAREGGAVKTEDDPLCTTVPTGMRETLAAIRHQEQSVCGTGELEGIALRYGVLYGPGTAIASDGAIVEMVRRRRLPVVGTGSGVWSFVHASDAARAAVLAVSSVSIGLYNIVDDDPAPISAWLPALAEATDAMPPRRIPAWLASIALGEAGMMMMTSVRGGSNVKARTVLGWRPDYASWRQGFVSGLR